MALKQFRSRIFENWPFLCSRLSAPPSRVLMMKSALFSGRKFDNEENDEMDVSAPTLIEMSMNESRPIILVLKFF